MRQLSKPEKNALTSLACVILAVLFEIVALKLSNASKLDTDPWSLIAVHMDLFMISLSILMAGHFTLPDQAHTKLNVPGFIWIFSVFSIFALLAIKETTWGACLNHKFFTILLPDAIGFLLVYLAVKATRS